MVADPAEPAAELGPVAFRRLYVPDEFRAVEEVQRAAWGMSTDGPVPTTIQRAIADNGGVVIGAFVGGTLVGFSLGFLAREGTRLYHYSHMTAVRPEYQHHHIGFGLKVFQRAEAQREGLDEVRWTFDPLQARNAWLNVRRLGGRPDRYYPNYYGPMGDALNEGLETDRLRLVWSLDAPRVVERLGGRLPSAADDQAAWERTMPMVETALGPAGLRRPAAVHAPSGPEVRLEIPYDLGSVRLRDRPSLRRWREAVREAFTSAFALGYRVDDFASLQVGTERRSCYLLVLSEAAGAT